VNVLALIGLFIFSSVLLLALLVLAVWLGSKLRWK